MPGITTLIIVGAVMFCVLGGITLLAYVYNLNGIKSKTVGDGQHGTARWATKTEIRKTYQHVPFTPKRWREQAKDHKTPTDENGNPLPQGIVVGCIEFDEKHPYSVAEHGNRKVEYAEKKGIQDGIMKKYHPQEYAELQEADKASASGGQDQAEAQRHEPQKTPPQGDSSKDKSKSGGGLKPERRDRSIREAVSEVKSDGQA